MVRNVIESRQPVQQSDLGTRRGSMSIRIHTASRRKHRCEPESRGSRDLCRGFCVRGGGTWDASPGKHGPRLAARSGNVDRLDCLVELLGGAGGGRPDGWASTLMPPEELRAGIRPVRPLYDRMQWRLGHHLHPGAGLQVGVVRLQELRRGYWHLLEMVLCVYTQECPVDVEAFCHLGNVVWCRNGQVDGFAECDPGDSCKEFVLPDGKKRAICAALDGPCFSKEPSAQECRGYDRVTCSRGCGRSPRTLHHLAVRTRKERGQSVRADLRLGWMRSRGPGAGPTRSLAPSWCRLRRHGGECRHRERARK